MERGAWQATVHGVTRVGHDLGAKPPPPPPPPQSKPSSPSPLKLSQTPGVIIMIPPKTLPKLSFLPNKPNFSAVPCRPVD